MVITDLNALEVRELAVICSETGMRIVIEDGKITGAVSEEE